MPIPKFNIHWTSSLVQRLQHLQAQLLPVEHIAAQLQWECGNNGGRGSGRGSRDGCWLTEPVVLRKMQELYFREKMGVWWE
jgi:hypothetical protein